jgi:hypothetical protein
VIPDEKTPKYGGLINQNTILDFSEETDSNKFWLKGREG